MLHVVRGNPTAEELAAITAVLAALPGRGAARPAPTSAWADRRVLLRSPLTAGPGRWRRSGRPG